MESQALLDAGFGFPGRVALLFALMALVAGVDRLRNGRAATRWREYLFLAAHGAIGALAAVGIDLVTSTISPEYFILGKGAREGAAFRGDVVAVGIEAGFGAGCLVAGTLLFAGGPLLAPGAPTWAQLHRDCRIVLAIALGGAAVIGAAAASLAAPLPFECDLQLQADAQRRFDTVWWTHLGAYAGALAGLAARAMAIRRSRATHAAPEGRPTCRVARSRRSGVDRLRSGDQGGRAGGAQGPTGEVVPR